MWSVWGGGYGLVLYGRFLDRILHVHNQVHIYGQSTSNAMARTCSSRPAMCTHAILSIYIGPRVFAGRNYSVTTLQKVVDNVSSIIPQMNWSSIKS